MKMIKVKSSNIESIGYSENLFQLVVEFKATDRSKAKTFAYEDVSPAEHEALMNADSIGKHFSSYIKGVKEFSKHIAKPSEITKDEIIAAQAERIESLQKALLDAVNHIEDGLNISTCIIIGELNADEYLIARFRKLLDTTP